MDHDLVRPADVGPDVVGRWRDLAARALEPNPFFEPDVVLPAARLLGPPDDLRLLMAVDGDRIHALVPVVRAGAWARLPVPAATAWVHDYCFLGTPLVDRERSAEAVGALLAGARATGRPTPLLVLPKCAVDGEVAEALRAAAPVSVDRPYLRAVAPTGDAAPRVPGKVRREQSRLRRRLDDATGAAAVVVDRAGDTAAVDAFLALEASGWKGDAGTALGRRAGHDEFFRRLCAAFAAHRRLVLHALEADGSPVAMLCGIVGGDTTFWFKTAFDERYAASTPGVQLLVELTDRLGRAEAGHRVDSCANPGIAALDRLWSHRRRVGTILLTLGDSRSGRALGRLFLRAVDRRHGHAESEQ